MNRLLSRRTWLKLRPASLIEFAYVWRDWGLPLSAQLSYHRARHLRKILGTPPVRVGDRRSAHELGLHLLVNRSRSLEGMWAVKSFAWYGEVPFSLTIHDDGSMHEGDFRRWEKHFPGCRIIRKEEGDRRVTSFLMASGLTQLQQWREHFPLSRKFVDVVFFATSRFVLLLDTDILFARTPGEIIDPLQGELPYPLYNEDFTSCYSLQPEKLATILRRDIFRRVNSGLVVFQPSLINQAETERDLDMISDVLGPEWYLDHGRGWLLEQTLYALEMTKQSGRPLPSSYMVGQLPEPPDLACGHYCTRARLDLYRKAMPRLFNQLKRGFEPRPAIGGAPFDTPSASDQRISNTA